MYRTANNNLLKPTHYKARVIHISPHHAHLCSSRSNCPACRHTICGIISVFNP